MAQIIIVNEQDEIVGSVDRGQASAKDIYRVSALWVENSQGEVLLAQRVFSKKHDPGKWGPAVSGTVEVGETYDSNIHKEAEEELGLVDINFEKMTKVRVVEDYNYFCQWYKAVINKAADEFQIDRAEVESVKWISKEDLKKSFKENPEIFVSGFKQIPEIK